MRCAKPGQPIGQFIDGNEVEVTFRSIHGMFAGMNDAGKSNLLNVHTGAADPVQQAINHAVQERISRALLADLHASYRPSWI